MEAGRVRVDLVLLSHAGREPLVFLSLYCVDTPVGPNLIILNLIGHDVMTANIYVYSC